MSDSESTSSGSTSSFTSIQEHLATLCAALEEYDDMAENIQTHMATMEAPVTSVALASFAQPTHLKEAPFRHEHFNIRLEAQNLFGLGETASFRVLCKHVRDTLFREGCVGQNGVVTLTPALSDFFGIHEPTSYLNLLTLEKFVV